MHWMLHAANYILKSTKRVKEWKDNIDSDSALQASDSLNCLMIQFVAQINLNFENGTYT